jgi:hypothetical protein
MNEPQHCPDAETLAAFIDRKLTDPERRAIVQHLADCDDCLAVAGEATRFSDSEDSLSGRDDGRGVRRFPAPALLAAAAMLIVVLGTAIFMMRRDAQPQSYERLVTAANDMTYRPYEGRLSGEFTWLPPQPVMRSGEPATPSDRRWLSLQSAAAAVLADPKAGPDHRAAAELLAGEAESAADSLRARAENSRDADLWSDLAAAELTLASRNGDRDTLLRALAAAERALEIDDRHAAAWFNRGLAAERLSRISDAHEAFTRYLELDPASPWADEARERLERLRQAGDGAAAVFRQARALCMDSGSSAREVRKSRREQ